jgi:glycosyltransferase involved in cell wall biosynthesis
MQFIKKHNIEDLVFVMGGGFWEHFIAKLNSAVSDLNTEKIIKIGYVDDADLPVLYSGAEWFTYTSEYEGFGSPVLEAMKCGCPVITSDFSSTAEVTGNAGVLVDPLSVDAISDAMTRVYTDETFRRKLIEKGYEREKEFSWASAAEKTLDIYKEILYR